MRVVIRREIDHCKREENLNFSMSDIIGGNYFGYRYPIGNSIREVFLNIPFCEIA